MVWMVLKTILRSMVRHKTHSLINLLGLTAGMVVVVMILMLVKDDLSWDRHHQKADRTYRVIAKYETQGQKTSWAVGEHKLAPLLKEDLPEAERMVRVGAVNPSVRYKDRVFQENRFLIADPDIFDVFDFTFLRGQASTALLQPNAVVVSESTARKYFGEEEAVGQTLTILDGLALTVTGVFADMPRRSHFHADFILSMASERSIYPDIVFDNWGELSVYTYVVWSEPIDPHSLAPRLQAFVKKHMDAETAAELRYELQPLTRIHLESHRGDVEAGANETYLYAFLAIALATLIIAGVNYTNLTTARSTLRAKEVGIRKTLGADRRRLMIQFYGESILFATVSFLVALPVVDLLLPWFNALSQRTLSISEVLDAEFLAGLVGVALGIGVLSGTYPAVFLSAFQPIKILKGNFVQGKGGANLRKIFMTVQFTVAVALIASALVIRDQMTFVRTVPLGFEKEHLLNISIPSEDVQNRFSAIKTEMEKVPGVQAVSRSSKPLGGFLSSQLSIQAKDLPSTVTSIQVVAVDHDFVRTIGAQIAAGRDLSESFASDAENGFILNEAAVRHFEWTDAVGQGIETATLDAKNAWIPKRGEVVGVVKDFHFEPLHRPIVPVLFYISENWGGYFVLRLNSEDIAKTLGLLESLWKKMAPNQPFDYKFVDERIEEAYQSQARLSSLIVSFAVFAIAIACLGLFGLASFAVERRIKEIGVRKVMGASSASVVFLVSREFLALVALAIAIAAPIAWWLMDRWLAEFAYRVEVSAITLGVAGLLAMLVAWVTVFSKAYRAALTNPAEALHYE